MDQRELADRFDSQRARLRSIAYRITGSLSEADDAVQEAWLRLTRAPADEIDSLERWLTTVVARICLNVLREHHAHPHDGGTPFAILAFAIVGDRAVAIDVFNDRELVSHLVGPGRSPRT